MKMKSILLAVSVLALLMGVLALIPGLEYADNQSLYATEPQWHAAIKVVIGLAGIFVALKSEKNIKNTLLVIGVVLLLMGVAGLIPGIDLGQEPMWHAAVKVVVGIVALFFVFKKAKK